MPQTPTARVCLETKDFKTGLVFWTDYLTSTPMKSTIPWERGGDLCVRLVTLRRNTQKLETSQYSPNDSRKQKAICGRRSPSDTIGSIDGNLTCLSAHVSVGRTRLLRLFEISSKLLEAHKFVERKGNQK